MILYVVSFHDGKRQPSTDLHVTQNRQIWKMPKNTSITMPFRFHTSSKVEARIERLPLQMLFH